MNLKETLEALWRSPGVRTMCPQLRPFIEARRVDPREHVVPVWPDHKDYIEEVLGDIAKRQSIPTKCLVYADVVAVYTDLGITEKMNVIVQAAEKIGVPVVYRNVPGWKR